MHKFGRKGVDNFEEFIRELESQPGHTVGYLFVFVDECHRTQSGKLHQTIKALMPNALFVRFIGTPLLKKDAATTLEGRKFSEITSAQFFASAFLDPSADSSHLRQ